jgi:hypothetical protein
MKPPEDDMTLSLCLHRLATSEGATVGSRVVIDSPAYAWRNADDEARCYTQLNDDFVHDYRAQLDEKATEAMSRVLEQVWAERFAAVGTALLIAKVAGVLPMDMRAPKFELVWGSDDDVQHRPHQPSDETYWSVWDEAASRLDPYEIVRAADLDDVLAREYAD